MLQVHDRVRSAQGDRLAGASNMRACGALHYVASVVIAGTSKFDGATGGSAGHGTSRSYPASRQVLDTPEPIQRGEAAHQATLRGCTMSKPAGTRLCRRPCATTSERWGARLACPLHPASAANGVLGLVRSTSVPMLCEAMRANRKSTHKAFRQYSSNL